MKKNHYVRYSVVLMVSLFVCLSAAAQQNTSLKLWYDKPAVKWEEALPLGNGRLGTMLYGNPQKEELQLNEGTIWAGGPNNNINPAIAEYIPQIRQLLGEGKYAEAQALADKNVKSLNDGMPYQPAGNLFMEFAPYKNISEYYRDLNIEDAVATVSYRADGIKYKREVFTSFTDQVIIVRLTADKPGSITCKLSLKSPQKHAVSYEKNTLLLTGVTGDHEGVKGAVEFEGQFQVLNEGGKVAVDSSGIAITKANAATVYISIATNFKNYRDISADEHARASQYLQSALRKKYTTALTDHKNFYKKYFNRVTLNLGATASVQKPTDQRLAAFATSNDPHLAALYFQYGRYLLICGSQPGGQPTTLQGIWNHHMTPPWDSKYTININTEMNYWPAEVTNLSELHDPLFKMLDDLSHTGQESAVKTYGARGWVCHHNTDLWRVTDPVDGAHSWGMWPMGGAWLSQHLWEHYMFTGDVDFLEQYYHVLKGASRFFVDVLHEDKEHHWLVVSPSVSPENTYKYNETQKASITAGATMDNQLLFDLFGRTIKAADILKVDKAFADSLKEIRSKLAPMQIGKHGQLQEWLHDWDNPEDKHRHVSHLYGLYPSNQISPYRNPELFRAAKNTLIQRGDVSTGWSMGWKVNFWARLQDGNHAFKLITDQLKPVGTNEGGGGTYPNLFDAHPPFQIDGNYGCTSGIAEMFVQSHDGALHILPALPDAWKDGEVRGLVARGGFEVDIVWKEKRITSLKVRSKLGGVCRLRVHQPLKANGNFTLKEATGENANPFYAVENVKTPIVSPQAQTQLGKIELQASLLYDVATEAGTVYTFVPF